MSDDKDVLTLNQLYYLAEIMRGVERNAKLRLYMRGADDADHPMEVIMRAFTHDGGGFLSEEDDVRDAFIWTSGFSEHWLRVRWLMAALSNLDGHLGFKEPMAVIEHEE